MNYEIIIKDHEGKITERFDINKTIVEEIKKLIKEDGKTSEVGGGQMKRIKSVEPITGTPQDYFYDFKKNVEGVVIPDLGEETKRYDKIELVKEVQRMLLENDYSVMSTKTIGDFMKKAMKTNKELYVKNKDTESTNQELEEALEFINQHLEKDDNCNCGHGKAFHDIDREGRCIYGLTIGEKGIIDEGCGCKKFVGGNDSV